MEKEIPNIHFKRAGNLSIEVMNLSELYDKLNQTKNHSPFVVHKIHFFLILIITKKSYTHFVDFKSYTLSEGSALFIAKSQIHHFTKDLRKAEGYCIVFNNALMDRLFFLSNQLKLNRLFNYHIESPVIHKEEMGEDSLSVVAELLKREYSFDNDFAKSEMLITLLHVILLKAERVKDSQSILGIKTQWLETFSSFRNLLEEEYVISRNSRLYASKLLISYKFLNDIIKRLTGKTVKAFIDEFVVMEIKRYLVSTSLSIKEIAYKTGFEEPANMVRFFKKNTQITPLKFRRQN